MVAASDEAERSGQEPRSPQLLQSLPSSLSSPALPLVTNLSNARRSELPAARTSVGGKEEEEVFITSIWVSRLLVAMGNSNSPRCQRCALYQDNIRESNLHSSTTCRNSASGLVARLAVATAPGLRSSRRLASPASFPCIARAGTATQISEVLSPVCHHLKLISGGRRNNPPKANRTGTA